MRHTLPLVAAWLAFAGTLTAQPPAPAPSAPSAPTAPPPPAAGGGGGAPATIEQLIVPLGQPVDLSGLPEPVRLGVRVENVRRGLPVIPVVVLVPDEASYVRAIAGWSPAGRYPVLIDDGTWSQRENLARFVRAMGPGVRVVRFAAKAEAAGWPAEPTPRRAIIEAALQSAWGLGPDRGLLAGLTQLGLTPPGIVAADINDGAWTAALALAAGRGQPIAWVKRPEGLALDGTMPLSEADGLSQQIIAAAGATGLRWQGLGDDLDALTVCMNTPTRVIYSATDDPALGNQAGFSAKPNESFAATDVLGRHALGNRADRWAWAGQIFGTPAEAAYRAMSALFLHPDRAWFFHGYQSGPGWDAFNPAEAARVLVDAGWVVRSDGAPRQSATNFRDAASGDWVDRLRATAGAGAAPRKGDPRGGTWAGLIGVNTSGNAEFFDLRPGRAWAADVPVLGVPSLVYFVHSWSAQRPGSPETIAGRFFRHGAYAYVGSVQEPFLHAFQPTPRVPLRLRSPAPLGAAARLDNAPMWRVNVLGDPLLTLGPPAPRSDRPLPLEGATALEDELREQLKGKDLAAGLATLALLGRDADVLRLARAAMEDKAVKPTPELALAAIGPAFRRVDFDTFTRLAELALLRADEQPLVRDLVWHALWPTITQLPDSAVDLLSRAVRPDNAARDVEEVGRALRRVKGADAERGFYDAQIARAGSPEIRRAIEQVRTAAAGGK